ncbi:hypothetical protein ACSSS7_000902 [Eimeria intestinalis]
MPSEEAVDWHARLREELLTKPGFPDIRKYVTDDCRFTADFVHEGLNVSLSAVLYAANELMETLPAEIEAAMEDFVSGFMPVCQRSVRFGESLGGKGLVTITVRRPPPTRLSDLDVEKLGLDPQIAVRYAEWRRKQEGAGDSRE